MNIENVKSVISKTLRKRNVTCKDIFKRVESLEVPCQTNSINENETIVIKKRRYLGISDCFETVPELIIPNAIDITAEEFLRIEHDIIYKMHGYKGNTYKYAILSNKMLSNLITLLQIYKYNLLTNHEISNILNMILDDIHKYFPEYDNLPIDTNRVKEYLSSEKKFNIYELLKDINYASVEYSNYMKMLKTNPSEERLPYLKHCVYIINKYGKYLYMGEISSIINMNYWHVKSLIAFYIKDSYCVKIICDRDTFSTTFNHIYFNELSIQDLLSMSDDYLEQLRIHILNEIDSIISKRLIGNKCHDKTFVKRSGNKDVIYNGYDIMNLDTYIVYLHHCHGLNFKNISKKLNMNYDNVRYRYKQYVDLYSAT